jgi:hypothetical protein
MNDKELVAWLFDNGGPAIRYRTAVDLMDDCPASGRKELAGQLLTHKKVKLLLPLLDTFPAKPVFNHALDTVLIHSGKHNCFEQAVAMLIHLGLRKGIAEFDSRMDRFREYIDNEKVRKAMNDPEDVRDTWALLPAFYATPYFLWAGYNNDASMNFAKSRIDSLNNAAFGKNFDIHESIGERPIMKPEYDPCIGATPLPIIHDLILLAYFPENLKDKKLHDKINTIINYILHEEFQSLPINYGYLNYKSPSGKPALYSCGWRPVLPCFFDMKPDTQNRTIILYLTLMSRFKPAIQSRWFKTCVGHLEKFRTETGTYCFPPDCLTEKKEGYYVLGSMMGLEDRRTKKSLELESTFWMCLINKNIKEAD